MIKREVAIVGGGPAGATAAMYLAREGIRSVIIEKEAFPRYHIGESMTGECGAVLRDLGLEDEMIRRGFPQKKGVVVYGPNGASHSWYVPVMARDEANQLQDQFTWQVRRDEFDRLMLDEAVARGAMLMHGRATRALVDPDGKVSGVEVRLNDGGLATVACDVLLDCSGQATFLANQGITGPKYMGNYDKQVAIFSHVINTVRDGDSSRRGDPDNTLIFYKSKFHWAWFIPLSDEAVSVGVVVPSAYFVEQNESKPDFLRRELRELNPELARRIPEVHFVEDVHAIPNYSFQVKDFCGKGYMCLGDSHRFVDPIFSFGLYVAMKEAQYAAPAIKAYINGHNRDADNPFADFQLFCEKAIDVLEDSIDLFWEQPFAFSIFVHSRYTEHMTDTFAGRIYSGQPSPALQTIRKMLDRDRESSYVDEDIYSVPIGSRYHPERAPLWAPDSPIDTTEVWMRDA